VGHGGVLLKACQEEVAAAEGDGQVPFAAPGWDEGGEGREGRVMDGAGRLEEEAEEGRRVELPEAAAEVRGGDHRAAPRPAGERGADERREGGEAEEDPEQEVVREGVDGGGA